MRRLVAASVPRRRAVTHRAAAILVTCLALIAPAAAHDIPDQIVLHAFVKPEGTRLQVLVRVPLVMLLNLDLPKRGPGFLALDRLEDVLVRAAKATAEGLPFYEDGRRIEPVTARGRISSPSSRAFESYEAARALIDGPPLSPETELFWNQGFFDAHFEYVLARDDARIATELLVAPGLQGRLKLILRYLPPGDDTVRAYQLHYGGGPVLLDPRWYQAAGTFLVLGTQHMLDGIDHLLFLLCLVAPFRLRHLWSLVAVVTAFTVAHSITLAGAATGLAPSGAWFPPLVEVLIALSIVYMAIENVVGANLRRRWAVAGVFGLVHGFGFSFVLEQELQLAGSHLALSLLAFNVGVEIGQLLFLLVVLPILGFVLRSPRAERVGTILVSVLAGHTAWHWMVERYEDLSRQGWPASDERSLAIGATVMALVIGLAVVAWRSRRRGVALTPSARSAEGNAAD